MDDYKTLRIQHELRKAGVSRYGMTKLAVRYLHNVIDNNEHIGGVVYGRYADNGGVITLNAGLLAATDKRIIFLDHKPGYTRTDDIPYDTIGEIELTTAVFSTVTLFAGAAIYKIRFANNNCARKFVRYVEKMRLAKNKK